MNKRRVYGGDENETAACPNCGCRHFETRKIGADKLSVTFRATCRYCGFETTRTVAVEVESRGDSGER